MKTLLLLSLSLAGFGLMTSCETEVAVVPTPAPRTSVTTEETVTTRSTPYGTVQTQTVQSY